jgi:hypothetical protein
VGEASRLVAHRGLFLVAGVRLPFKPSDGQPVALVLARPLTQEELTALSPAPLLVSNGREPVAAAGDSGPLAALTGRESEAPVTAGDAVAVARPFGDVWLWSLQPISAEVAPAVPPVAATAGGALLGLAVVALSARRRPKPIPLTQPMLATDSRAPRREVVSQSAFAQTSRQEAGRNRYLEVAPLGEGGMAKVSLVVTHGAEGFRRHFVL